MARQFAGGGQTDWINCGDIDALDGLSALSVSCWVKFTSFLVIGEALVAKVKNNGGGSYDGWALQMWYEGSGNDFLLRISNANATHIRTTDCAMSTGIWYQVCMVYDGSLSGDTNRLKCWMNGTQRATSVTAAGVPASCGSSVAPVEIGNMHQESLEYGVQGHLAEVGVWNRALTSTEAVAVTSGKAPSFLPDGLIVYMPLTGQNSPEPNLVAGRQSIQGVITNAIKTAHPDGVRYPSRGGATSLVRSVEYFSSRNWGR